MELSVIFFLSAFGLGALHALEPGHGKTVVAAYLVGTKGRKIDAVVLGLVVTVTHSFSAIALAVIAKLASDRISLTEEALHGSLGLVAGLLILIVGGCMLVSRLRGGDLFHGHSHGPGDSHSHSHSSGHSPAHNRDSHHHAPRKFAFLEGDHDDHHASSSHVHEMEHAHVHSDGTVHSHVHHPDGNPSTGMCFHNSGHTGSDRQVDHDHSDNTAHTKIETDGRRKRLGNWQLFLLGISGGLVPCPAAIVILLASVASGRIDEGLAYILLFSLGLAAALIAIGITVVSAGKLAARFLDAQKFARRVSIASAAIITLIGVITVITSINHLV